MYRLTKDGWIDGWVERWMDKWMETERDLDGVMLQISQQHLWPFITHCTHAFPQSEVVSKAEQRDRVLH